MSTTTGGPVEGVAVLGTAGAGRLQVAPASGAGERTVAAAAEETRRWRPDIQGLRAVAVLLVVLYHAHVPRITGGYVGVDVFFVISGFLISGHLVREAQRRGRVDYLGFYGSRARRLLPSAVLVVAVTTLVERLWGALFGVKAIAWDAIFTAFYGLNWRLAAEGIDYQEGAGRVSPFQHFWSLAVEEQFYIVWPLVIGACVLLGGRHRWRLLTLTFSALAVGSLWASLTLTPHNAPLAYFALHTRGWELAAGALLALGAHHAARLPAVAGGLLGWAGLAAILVSALAFNETTPFPGSAALVPVLGAVAVIAAGCTHRPPRLGVEALLDIRPAQVVGRISYGWYLWHWPVLVLAPVLFGHDVGWSVNLELVLVAGWLAVLSYHLVERQSALSPRPTRQWLGIGAALSTAGAVLAAVVIATFPALVGTGSPAAAVSLGASPAPTLSRALNAGLTVRAVPSNLTPRLADADADQPASTDDGCHLGFLATRQPTCRYGDPAGTRTAVLLGDSHAQQWLPGLATAATQQHVALYGWTKSACPIADVRIFNDTLHREYAECDRWRAAMVARVLKLHPAAVVLGQSDSVPGTQVSDARWAQQTAALARTFAAAGIAVTYVLDTPYHPRPVPECLADHLSDASACTMVASEGYEHPGRRPALVAALRDAGIRTVSPETWLCPRGSCPPVVADMLVYRDASHLTATYSRWLAPLLGALLQR